MTSPEQQPAPEPDPRDEADEQPSTEELPAPDAEQPVDAPKADADVPDAPLSLEPDETAIPESDRAPEVLSETPVGGKLAPGSPEPAQPDEADAPVRDMPAPQDLAAAQPEPETPPAPEETKSAPDASDVEQPAQAAIEDAPAPPEDEPAPPVVSVVSDEAPAAPTVEEAPPPPSAAEAETPPGGTIRPVEAPAEAPVEYESAPPPVSVARAQDWDEDISPELAAILFGGAGAASAAKEAAEPAPAEPAVEEAPEAPAPAPTPAPAAPRREAPVRPREPVMVTTADQARSQPISAGDFASPPPDAPVKGKMRYLRVEEPLRGDKGRHIEERWEYFGPDYPALEGRLVKRVQSEEWAYADGSWKLTFRRDYSQGRDERTVRISSDGEYAERTDRIRRPDAATGKTTRQRERVTLRYAAPIQEEKRGFLGGLFRRGNGPQTEGAKRWRPATDSEERTARQTGGEAFKLGLFERR